MPTSNTTDNQRTSQQNRALHLYLEHLAQTLNDAGLDMKKTLKPGVEIPWTAKTAKEFLYRPIMTALTLKKSTTELTTTECTKVYEILNRHLGERFGISIPWPNYEDLLLEKETNAN